MNATASRSGAGENETALRAGRLEDYKALVGLEQEIFGRHALDPGTIYWLLFRRWPGVIIAERDGEVVGYVITRINFLPWFRRRGGISSIAVHPRWQRRGIGRQLMLAAIEFLFESKAKAVDLEVDEKNETAIALYRSLGFEPKGKLENYYGPGEDGILMTLKGKPSSDS